MTSVSKSNETRIYTPRILISSVNFPRLSAGKISSEDDCTGFGRSGAGSGGCVSGVGGFCWWWCWWWWRWEWWCSPLTKPLFSVVLKAFMPKNFSMIRQYDMKWNQYNWFFIQIFKIFLHFNNFFIINYAYAIAEPYAVLQRGLIGDQTDDPEVFDQRILKTPIETLQWSVGTGIQTILQFACSKVYECFLCQYWVRWCI